MTTTNSEQTDINVSENSEPTNTIVVDEPTNPQPPPTNILVIDEPNDSQPPPTNIIVIDEPTNPQPPPTNILVIDEPTNSQPVPTNTPAVNEPLNFPPAPANPTVVENPLNVQPSSINIVVVEKPLNSQPPPINTAADVEKPLNAQPAPVEAVTTENITSEKPVETTILIDAPTTNVKLEVKDKSGAAGAIALVACLCGSSIALVVLFISAIIPFLQLIIGLKYADECPVNWRIPHFLVVAGTVGLVLIGLSIAGTILQLSGICTGDNRATITKFVLRIIPILVFLLTIFTFVWFIAGCVWVFGAWSEVQYKHPNHPGYCHRILYRFAFWLLIISILYTLFTCCRSYKQLREPSKKRKKVALYLYQQPNHNKDILSKSHKNICLVFYYK